MVKARPIDAEAIGDLARSQPVIGEDTEDAQAQLVADGRGHLHEPAWWGLGSSSC
jgi:hypothetical protein